MIGAGETMSEKASRQRRAIDRLASEAHETVHLLLDLGAAITDADASLECTARADRLAQALANAAGASMKIRSQDARSPHFRN
jgi:dihydroxyacetone kinase DhaKLM complex PTS-EIIA-like component DhaM